MHVLASRIGSVVMETLGMINANFSMPTWYGSFLEFYSSDSALLGYHVIAVALLMLVSCAHLLQKPKAPTYFELFPRSGGDVCKLCSLLNTTMSHYDKHGKRN
jgi:hypothetical protein